MLICSDEAELRFRDARLAQQPRNREHALESHAVLCGPSAFLIIPQRTQAHHALLNYTETINREVSQRFRVSELAAHCSRGGWADHGAARGRPLTRLRMGSGTNSLPCWDCLLQRLSCRTWRHLCWAWFTQLDDLVNGWSIAGLSSNHLDIPPATCRVNDKWPCVVMHNPRDLAVPLPRETSARHEADCRAASTLEAHARKGNMR